MAQSIQKLPKTAEASGRNLLDEKLYLVRLILLAGPTIILTWQAGRLAIPILAAIPLGYMVGHCWCAWAYHGGRSPRLMMVVNYLSAAAHLVLLIPVGATFFFPQFISGVVQYVLHLPVFARLCVLWILLEVPLEIGLSLFYARWCRRRLIMMGKTTQWP